MVSIIDSRLAAGLSIVASILFVIMYQVKLVGSALIVLTIVLSAVHTKESKRIGGKRSHATRVVSDRLSEGIMFIPFFIPWFPLFVLNVVLTIFSWRLKKRITVPLRWAFILYYVLLI